jgi:4-hydroxy-tetrahydrodipicolinate synthase
VADHGAIKEARELYLKYLPVIEFVGGQAYVAGSKALLSHMGLAVGNPRPPRLPLPPAQDAAALALVERFGLAWPTAALSRASA